jgi:hypothetical protein
MDLSKVMNDVTDAIVEVGTSRVPFRSFKPGVGPYGEPQLLKLIVAHLNRLLEYETAVLTKRTPDL